MDTLQQLRYDLKEEEIETRIHDAKAEGLAEGRAEEREKAHQEKIETAKNFLSMGLTVEQVAKGTGLSLAEIEALQR